eukprot:754065-Hanusia_phi.AAC.4
MPLARHGKLGDDRPAVLRVGAAQSTCPIPEETFQRSPAPTTGRHSMLVSNHSTLYQSTNLQHAVNL